MAILSICVPLSFRRHRALPSPRSFVMRFLLVASLLAATGSLSFADEANEAKLPLLIQEKFENGDDRANQIFIVDNADRKKISTKSTSGTPWDDNWHHVKVVRRIGDGGIEIYFDDMKTPIMTATDKTFTWGQVGLGSFDDSGNW